MATLVLTAVGTAIGGPIGGAIGALLGQRIDGDLFKPKGREGPRLTDLSLQTSSYGSAIARVFGTMRVAGSVIWSTDLIEARTTSHAKGQPSTTSYSYSASFAVLLSARPVLGVGRIWADGNLLRGAAGDLKVPTGFRLHLGGEDQAADPLIASIEGATLAPAHRGCAYAVFERMQLADFGNRIPSLTFELIADPDAVGAGAIAAEIAGAVIEDRVGGTMIHGFSAYGASARDTVDLLATASGARFALAGAAIAMTDSAMTEATVADDGYAAGTARNTTVRRSVAAIEGVPRTLSLLHYDSARDYQTSIQRARRPGAGNRDDQIEMPAVMPATAAKTMVEAVLAREEAAREHRTVTLDAGHAGVAPGMLVGIAGETGQWRVASAGLEAMVASLDLIRVSAPAPTAESASPGRVLPSPDRVPGQTILVAAELPALDDTILAAPRVTVLATGTGNGWRRAALLYSLDNGASWHDAGTTGEPAIIGTVVESPGIGTSTLFDLTGSILVDLARDDLVLADADDEALDRGGNLALLGDELIQFGSAEPLGGRRWRLSRLLRGRRGSEAAAGAQLPGDRFALIGPAAATIIDLPVAALGSGIRVLASGIGDSTPAAAELTIGGASVRPPSPVSPDVSTGEDGMPVLRWTRRSRAGFRWIDGGDAPLGEEMERYRVTVTLPGGASRVTATSAASSPLAPAEVAAGTVIDIRQAGTLAESAPVRIIV